VSTVTSTLVSGLITVCVDTSNPLVLLGLFNWSIQKTEISDARAWYKELAKDEPTAVSLPHLTYLEQAEVWL
jgi:hypothetical protein